MASVDGTWNIEIKTPIGVQKFTLELASEGTAATGTAVDKDGRRLPITSGTVAGDHVVVEFMLVKPFAMPLEITLDIVGDEATGVGKTGPFPPSKLTGVRAGR